MLQVARLAPKQLGDSAGLVADFLRGRLNPDGGFADRGGSSDLYYTVFGLEGLLALRADVPFGSVRGYLRTFGDGTALDFVHLGCLARCWAGLPKEMRAEAPADAVLRRIEARPSVTLPPRRRAISSARMRSRSTATRLMRVRMSCLTIIEEPKVKTTAAAEIAASTAMRNSREVSISTTRWLGGSATGSPAARPASCSPVRSTATTGSSASQVPAEAPCTGTPALISACSNAARSALDLASTAACDQRDAA